jgi:ankyrin repeat protein
VATNSKRSFARVTFVCVAVAAAVCFPVWTAARQQRLNRELIAAIKASKPDTVISLLESGADPNSRDVAHAKSLLELIRGVFVHSPEAQPTSDTALLVALNPQLTQGMATEPTMRIVKALIHKGANVKVVGRFRCTPLSRIFWTYSDTATPDILWMPQEHIELERVLIDAGANVNAADEGGYTVLMDASERGFIESARLLLERGADPNKVIPNSSPDTALTVAREFGHPDIVHLLKDHGARQ